MGYHTIVESQAHYHSKPCLASTAHLFTNHRQQEAAEGELVRRVHVRWWCHLFDNQHLSKFLLFLHDQGTQTTISLPKIE